MEDRDVQFPNRYRLTKVDGTDDIYDFEPVPGEVTEDGSLVNKSLLFSDIAAGMFGLFGNDATPNKAFEWLGKFNQHWWKRTAKGIYIEEEGAPVTTIFNVKYNTDKHTIRYSEYVNVNKDTGKVTLGDPIKTISIGVYGGSDGIVDPELEKIKGKYFIPYSDGAEVDYIAYLGSDAQISFKYDAGEFYEAFLEVTSGTCYRVISKIVSGESFYVYSADRSTYPDSGEQDGYEYEYLGIPFENLPGAPKIETGLYTGNGRYGKSNPNSLTFGFEPNILIVTGVGGSATKYQDIGFFIRNAERSFGTGAGQLSIYYNGGLDSSANVVTWNGKTVSWYSPSASNQASIQLNNRSTYNYVAFG